MGKVDSIIGLLKSDLLLFKSYICEKCVGQQILQLERVVSTLDIKQSTEGTNIQLLSTSQSNTACILSTFYIVVMNATMYYTLFVNIPELDFNLFLCCYFQMKCN